MTKAEKIAEMLRRFEEARETSHENGIVGSGDAVSLMPVTWNASYRELERCLVLLRADAPRLYDHVVNRYVGGSIRRATVPVRPGKKGPEPKVPAHTELVSGAVEIGKKTADVVLREWPAWVRESKCERGLKILAAYFEGEPYMPPEMLAA